MAILPSQSAQLAQAITNHGLDVQTFRFMEDAPHAKVRHFDAVVLRRNTPYFFGIHSPDDRFPVDMSPTFDRVRESLEIAEWGDVAGSAMSAWLESVARELATPDLWAEIARGHLAAPASDASDSNAMFDESERSAIVAGLAELRALVRASDRLTAEQARIANERFDYLEAATERLGRLDWRSAFLGAVIDLALQAIIPVDVVQGIFGMAARLFGQILGWSGPLLLG